MPDGGWQILLNTLLCYYGNLYLQNSIRNIRYWPDRRMARHNQFYIPHAAPRVCFHDPNHPFLRQKSSSLKKIFFSSSPHWKKDHFQFVQFLDCWLPLEFSPIIHWDFWSWFFSKRQWRSEPICYLYSTIFNLKTMFVKWKLPTEWDNDMAHVGRIKYRYSKRKLFEATDNRFA